MVSFLRYLQRLSLVFWLGEMLFFAFIFAPTVFRVLAREEAAKLQQALFPQYFTVGLVCGVLILVTEFLMRHFYTDAVINDRKYFVFLSVSIFCLAIFAYARFSVVPHMDAIRAEAMAVPAGTHEVFHKLHRLSVGLNGAALVGLIILLGLLA